MNVDKSYLVRAYRYARSDIALRAPELAFLANKRVAVFGLGCIGAPSALEFARAGVARLWVVDPDIVEPATGLRWPFGVDAMGIPKAVYLARHIEANYPYVDVEPLVHRIGGVQDDSGVCERGLLQNITQDADLIYDATAEIGVRHYLSEVARHSSLPYVYASGTHGGWGGEVVRIAPRSTEGCWVCMQCAAEDGLLPSPAAREEPYVQPDGCADPTFLAAGFDMLQIAVLGVRAAVSTLAEGERDAYPTISWDGLVISLRDKNGKASLPRFEAFNIRRHDRCFQCR